MGGTAEMCIRDSNFYGDVKAEIKKLDKEDKSGLKAADAHADLLKKEQKDCLLYTSAESGRKGDSGRNNSWGKFAAAAVLGLPAGMTNENNIPGTWLLLGGAGREKKAGQKGASHGELSLIHI